MSTLERDLLAGDRPLIVLRAARKPLPTRVGHPAFVGPVQPTMRHRDGAIEFEDDGTPFFVLRKAEWERKRDASLAKMLGAVA